MRKLLSLILLSCVLISAVPTVIDAPQVLSYAQDCLAHKGPLEKTEDGFVYVKVSDDYIFETVELLGNGEIDPPPYFGEGKVGAHITVIEAIESKEKRLNLPLGKPIAFKIVNFASVDVKNDEGIRRIYFFTVDAPELERIRKANGLSPKIHGYDFHITAAIENLEVEAAS